MRSKTKRIRINLDVKIDNLHRKLHRHQIISYVLKGLILALLSYLGLKI